MIGKTKTWLFVLSLILLAASTNFLRASAQSLPTPTMVAAVASGNNVTLNFVAPNVPNTQKSEIISVEDAVNGGNLIGAGTKKLTWLNKITPTVYPATLAEVQVGFAMNPLNDAEGLGDGAPVMVFIYKDPESDGPANGQTPDFMLRANITLPGKTALNIFDVSSQNITITSGSFVLGVMDTTGKKFPAAMLASTVTPASSASYFSVDNGVTYTQLSASSSGLSGLAGPPKGSWVIRGKFVSGTPGPKLTGYNVYRSLTTPVAITPANKLVTLDATATSYTDMNVPGANGTTVFYYAITAVYDMGESPLSNEVLAKPGTIPGQPGDFSIAVGPATQTVTAGASTSYTITPTPVNNFGDMINLAVTIAPADTNVTAVLSANSISPTGTSSLTINTGASAVAQTYTVTVTGTSGTLVHTGTTQLVVMAQPKPDYMISGPAVTVARKGSGTVTINITRTGGFTGNVTVTAPDVKKTLKLTFTSPTQSSTGANVSFPFKTKKKTPAGAQQLMFTAKDDAGNVRTTTVMLNVQ